MLYIVKMPKLSPTMETGTIIKWRKNINEYVNSDSILVDISTDKSVIEYSFVDEGWLREILIKDNEKSDIGTPIAIISSEKDELIDREQLLAPFTKTVETSQKFISDSSESSENINLSILENPSASSNAFYQLPSFAPETPLTHFSCPTRTAFQPQKISPLAKSIAQEKDLDLSGIIGSGPGGRIVEKDLSKAPKKNIVAFHQPALNSQIASGTYEEKTLSPIREIIGSRLQASKMTIPHFYIRQEINARKLIDLKNQLSNLDIKLSYNDFITRACALALKTFPNINSGFNSVNNTIVLFKTIDISFAVSIEEGLVTPIIRYADKKNILSLSLETKELANKAKKNQLNEHEYKGGSFCISNLGMTRIQEFSAIINPPQSAILAVGGLISKPVVEDNHVVPGHTLTLNLSLDHRVVDGYEAALFMKQLQNLLENPAILLVN